VNDVEVLKNTSKQRLHGAAALRLGTRLYTAGQSRTRTAQLGSTGSSRTRKGEVLVVHLDSWVLAEVEDDDVDAVVADARAQAWLGVVTGTLTSLRVRPWAALCSRRSKSFRGERYGRRS